VSRTGSAGVPADLGSPAWSVEATTASAAGTRALGAALASCVGPGDVVLLVGDLGAGKTTLAQGFAAGLGVAGPVTSPTFTLVREYPLPGGPAGPVRLLHADVYRLESLEEVADLGLAELVEEQAVLLVEWGDVAGPALGPSRLTVVLARPGPAVNQPADPDGVLAGDEPRAVTVSGRGPDWTGRRAEVAAAVARGVGDRP
jgi:tRNA threonylcarbamoyladenosine biosynthesis protein TsaE